MCPSYATTIGNDFILMDDNPRSNQAVLNEDYFEGQNLEQMEWPAQPIFRPKSD